MIRTYRRDLVEGRSEKEILELRLDPELTRAIMMRLVEQNADAEEARAFQSHRVLST